MGVSGGRGGTRRWRGAKGKRTSILEPKGLPIHRKAQHLQGRLKRSIRCLSLLSNDAIAGGDVLAPCCYVPAAYARTASARLIDDLQVEDDSTSLDLPRFNPTVEDANSLGERGDVQARGEATRVREGARHGIRARQRTPRHPVAAMNVFLQLVGGCKGIELRRGCKG